MTSPRSVLITGASAGIGRALAAEFSRRGDRTVMLARRGKLLRAIERELREEGNTCYGVPCDLRDDRAIARAVKRGARLTGEFDVLINNAGVTSFGEAQQTTVRQLDEILDVNLRALALVTMQVLPGMVKRKRGLIINILSYAAKTTYVGSSAYSASKAGAEAFMNVLREEVRGIGIRVMNVYPGAVLTPMWLPEHRKRFEDLMMAPGDVAALVYSASIQPEPLVVEELVLRPQTGDLNL